MSISSSETAQIIAQQQASSGGMWPQSPPAGWGAPMPGDYSAPGVVQGGPGMQYPQPSAPSMTSLATPIYDPRNPPAVFGQGPGPHTYGQVGGQPLGDIAGGMMASGIGYGAAGVSALGSAMSFSSVFMGDSPLGSSLLPHPSNIMDPFMGTLHGATLGMRSSLSGAGVRGLAPGFWGTMRGIGSQMMQGQAGRAVGMRALGAGAMGGAAAALPYMAIGEAVSWGGEQLMTGAQQQLSQQQFWSGVPRSAMPHMQGQMGSEWALGVGNMMRDMSFQDRRLDMGEMQGIMSNMVGSGQMADVQGLQDFEKKFKEGMQALKVVAKTMNTTLTDAQAFLEEQRQVGFLNPTQAGMNVAFSRGVAVTGGLQAGTMPAIAQQGAQVGWQLGMTRAQGAIMAEQNIAAMGMQVMGGQISRESVMEAMGTSNYDEAMVAFSGQMLQVGAQYTGGRRGQLLAAALANEDVSGIDPGKARMFQEGAYTESDLKRMASESKQRGGKTGRMRLMYQGDIFQQQMMQMIDPTVLVSQDVRGMVEQRYGDLDPEQQSIMEDVLMQKYTGLGKRDAELVRKAGEQGPLMRAEMKRKIMQEMENSQRPELSVDMIWEGLKQKYVGQYLDPVKQQLQQYGAEITQWGSGVVEDVMKDVLGVQTVTIGSGWEQARQSMAMGYKQDAMYYDPYIAMQARQQAVGGGAQLNFGGGITPMGMPGGGQQYGIGQGGLGWGQMQEGNVNNYGLGFTEAAGTLAGIGAPIWGAGFGVARGGMALGGVLGRIPMVGGLMEAGVGGLSNIAGRGMMGGAGQLFAPGRMMVGGARTALGGAAAGGLGGMSVGGAMAAAPATVAGNVLAAGIAGYELGGLAMGGAGYNLPDYEALPEEMRRNLEAGGSVSARRFRTTDELKFGSGEIMIGDEYIMTGLGDVGKTIMGNVLGLGATYNPGALIDRALGRENITKKAIDRYFQPEGIAKVADMADYETKVTHALRGGSIEEVLSYGDAYKGLKRTPSQEELGKAIQADLIARGDQLPEMGDMVMMEKNEAFLKWARDSNDPVLKQFAETASRDPRNKLAASAYLSDAYSQVTGTKLAVAPDRGDIWNQVKKDQQDMISKAGKGGIFDAAADFLGETDLFRRYTYGERVSAKMQGVEVKDPSLMKLGLGYKWSQRLEDIGTPFSMEKSLERFGGVAMEAVGLEMQTLRDVAQIVDVAGGGVLPFSDAINWVGDQIEEGKKTQGAIDSETFQKMFEGNFEDAPPGAVKLFEQMAVYANVGAMGKVTDEMKQNMSTLAFQDPAQIADQYGISKEDARAVQKYARRMLTADKDELLEFAQGMGPGVTAQQEEAQKRFVSKYIDPYRKEWKGKRGTIERTLRGSKMEAAGIEMMDLMDQIVELQGTGTREANEKAADLRLEYNRLARENPEAAQYLAGQAGDDMSRQLTGGGVMATYWEERLTKKGGKDSADLESTLKAVYAGVDQDILQDIISTGRRGQKKMTQIGVREQGRLTAALQAKGVTETQAREITDMIARAYEKDGMSDEERGKIADQLANLGLSPTVAGEIMTGKKGGLASFVEQLGPATENMEQFNQRMGAFLERTENSPLFKNISQ